MPIEQLNSHHIAGKAAEPVNGMDSGNVVSASSPRTNRTISNVRH